MSTHTHASPQMHTYMQTHIHTHAHTCTRTGALACMCTILCACNILQSSHVYAPAVKHYVQVAPLVFGLQAQLCSQMANQHHMEIFNNHKDLGGSWVLHLDPFSIISAHQHISSSAFNVVDSRRGPCVGVCHSHMDLKWHPPLKADTHS